MKNPEPGYCGTVMPDENKAEAANRIRNPEGYSLFLSNCASCHALDKNLTGPALRGVEERGPWTDRSNLYKWVVNPAAFIPKHAYTKELLQAYAGQVMPAFPQLTKDEVDAVFNYINAVQPVGY